MSEREMQPAQRRFIGEWWRNFAVSANAGSGKTWAISQRLAAMALAREEGADGHGAAPDLSRTAVVTYTKKAAQEMSQRARAALMERMQTRDASEGLAALAKMESVFFGTIHSFCIMLAQRYGHEKGINLKPSVVQEETDQDRAFWLEFVQEDSMVFSSLGDALIKAFLRHMALDEIFEFARRLTHSQALEFLARAPRKLPGGPDRSVLDEARRKGERQDSFDKKMARMRAWADEFEKAPAFLPFDEPEGAGGDSQGRFRRFYQPVKNWLAEAGATLAAELSLRYREWRLQRGIQTFADQIETALLVLRDDGILKRIRDDGWRVILDEAQDTDPQQFEILVEITRPDGARRGAWPDDGGEPPRAGHFCMVGDGQQSIYGSRADIRNFVRHVEAFTGAAGSAGEKLEFVVTYRTPRNVIAWLNQGFPDAFGRGRRHNLGLPREEGGEADLLQVKYQALQADAGKEDGGCVSRLPLELPGEAPERVDDWQAEEARQIAAFLRARGPEALGARNWGEVCVLAPRNSWLLVMREVFEEAGLKVALQMRKNLNRNNPVYAWMTGLMSVVCDNQNVFEWFGVLREVFAVSDAALVAELREREHARRLESARNWRWDEPGEHADAHLRGALEALYPFVNGVDDSVEEGGRALGEFAAELARACGLAEKARLLEPGGALNDELERLLAEAAALGLTGAGPREWLRRLRDGLESGRPSGKQEGDAINLLTVHSAKGLEWPVVVVAGFWRTVGRREDSGLRLIVEGGEGGRGARAFFDTQSIDDDTVESRAREQLRENVRLMYVALTRAQRHLVIPWCAGAGGVIFGKKQSKMEKKSEKKEVDKTKGLSFAELWGRGDLLDELEVCGEEGSGSGTGCQPVSGELGARLKHGLAAHDTQAHGLAARATLPTLPVRVLPHQLAHGDAVRAARHEASADDGAGARGDEAVEYGLWWHETLEDLPWGADEGALGEYFERALVAAGERCGERGAGRGREELARLRASEVLRELREGRWAREAELPVFAPADETGGAWIDGIMDFVAHDAGAGEVRVVDWKTNQRRAGESDGALLARLEEEYAPQLRAYGWCAGLFFPGARVRLFVYSSAAGKAVEVEGGGT